MQEKFAPSELGRPHAQTIWSEVHDQLGGEIIGVHTEHDNRENIIVGEDYIPRYTIKMDMTDSPPGGVKGLEYEAAVLLAASQTPEPSPLPLQRLLMQGDNYLVTSWLPGVTFDIETLRKTLSPEERALAGHDLGKFVVWNAANDVSPNLAKPVLTQEHLLYERWMRWSRDFVTSEKGHQLLSLHGLKNLQDIVEWVMCDTEAPSDARKLFRPTHLAHNDLSNHNLVFQQQGDMWRLGGVIDWGSSAHSSVQRELRHLTAFGREAVEGALAGMEAAGRRPKPVDLPLIHDWAVIQVATAAVWQLRGGTKDYPAARYMMESVMGAIDWSELNDMAPHVWQ